MALGFSLWKRQEDNLAPLDNEPSASALHILSLFLQKSKNSMLEHRVFTSWRKREDIHPQCFLENKNERINSLFLFCGGSERIRTSGTVARSHAFQACSLNHSDTLPYNTILAYFLTFVKTRMSHISDSLSLRYMKTMHATP